MTEQTLQIAGFAVAFLTGMVVGFAYFAALWRSTSSLSLREPGTGTLQLLLGYVLRTGFVLAALLLAMKAGAGAVQIFLAAGGFTIARIVLTRRRLRQD